MTELVGTTFDGRYRLCEHLGYGISCDVYRAEQRAIGVTLREVALKVFTPERTSPKAQGELVQEALRLVTLIERCDDPTTRDHLLMCFDAGIERGPDARSFIAMELASERLAAELAGGPLPPVRALLFARQIAEALAYLHSVDYLHRDLKPDNVFLAPGHRIKIGDFGLATPVTNSPDGQAETVGDLAYQSPEALATSRYGRVDEVYSVGLMCYEMLVGHQPFEHELAEAVRTQDLGVVIEIRRRALAPLRVGPPEFLAVVVQALAPRRADRYPDGAALLRALAGTEPPRPSPQPDPLADLHRAIETGDGGLVLTSARTLAPRLPRALYLTLVVTLVEARFVTQARLVAGQIRLADPCEESDRVYARAYAEAPG